jgi:polysaccharide export outer membrane protein
MKIRFILLLCALSLLAACHSSQELAYFSDAERDSVQAVLSTYNTTIHPGDQLYIYVYSQAPEIAVPFNQETHSIAAEITHLNSVGGTNRSNKMSETFQQSNFSQIPGYLVDEAGTIVFPILGKMVVAGLTQDSLSRRIQNMLIDGGYINDPVVTVTPMNFRVTVIGEVSRPQELHITGDRLTILEAIAMCGD